MPRTIKITVQYDGTNYFGWQRQFAGEPTIQQHVEDALGRVLGERIRIAGSSRTDRGVHAIAHPASFVTQSGLPTERIVFGGNAHLPPDIRLQTADEMPEGFHAQFDAKAKTYRYSIFNGPVAAPLWRRFCAFESRPMVVAAMRHAATIFVGRHDFFSLATHGKLKESTVRTIFRLDVARRSLVEPDVIDITVEGDGFLYNMVRTIAGTLLEVGIGKRAPSSLHALLQTRDRKPAGPNLPANGLTLVAVRY